MHENSEIVFARGIELFNRGDYFECHEILEELWTPSIQPERWFLQSLIHFAVALHHHQCQNAIGASRQLTKGLGKIHGYLPERGGIRTDNIAGELRRCLDIIESGGDIDPLPTIQRFASYRPAGRTVFP